MGNVRTRGRIAVVSIVLLGMCAAVPTAASAYPGCGHSTLARDYLKELKRAAPINVVPVIGDRSTKQLPFAPAGLRLHAVGSDVVVDASQVGFKLSNSLLGPVQQLDWIVESQLVKTDDRGEDIRRLGSERRILGTLKKGAVINLLHPVSATPGYYRVDIRFVQKMTGRVLGQYGSYTRVMKPRVDLRVRIDTPSILPGEIARATLLNLGTVPLVTPSYDFGFSVQMLTGEKWSLVADNPQRRIPKRGGPWTLPAGMENRGCLRYLVPSDQAPGLFRFVTFGVGADPQIGKIAAQFQVASGL